MTQLFVYAPVPNEYVGGTLPELVSPLTHTIQMSS